MDVKNTTINDFLPSNGFSLIGLLIVLALSGWLMSIGMPTLYEWLGRFQTNAALQELQATMLSARYQALKRNFPIRLCPAGNVRQTESEFEYQCGSHWQQGVIMYAVTDKSKQPSSQWIKESQIIKFTQRAKSNHWFITLKNTQNIPHLTFYPNGRLSGGNGRFIGCVKHKTLPIKNQLVFFYTGRTYLFKSHLSDKDKSLCSSKAV